MKEVTGAIGVTGVKALDEANEEKATAETATTAETAEAKEKMRARVKEEVLEAVRGVYPNPNQSEEIELSPKAKVVIDTVNQNRNRKAGTKAKEGRTEVDPVRRVYIKSLSRGIERGPDQGQEQGPIDQRDQTDPIIPDHSNQIGKVKVEREAKNEALQFILRVKKERMMIDLIFKVII